MEEGWSDRERAVRLLVRNRGSDRLEVWLSDRDFERCETRWATWSLRGPPSESGSGPLRIEPGAWGVFVVVMRARDEAAAGGRKAWIEIAATGNPGAIPTPVLRTEFGVDPRGVFRFY